MTTAPASTRRLLAITAAPDRGPDPSLAAVVAAAAGAVRGKAAPGTPALRGETTRRLTAPLASPPPLSEVAAWIGSAASVAGQPVNLTVSAATHDAHIHVASAAAFRSWCDHLRIPASAVRWSTTVLGALVEASTTTNGWAMHVRLFGSAVEELR